MPARRRERSPAVRSTAVARRAAADPRVLEIQRARLIAAAVSVIDELGYAHTTVAQITTRARVSRRTFYELFTNREECLTAVLDQAVGTLTVEVAAQDAADLPWLERIRGGLHTILVFFDREPALARVCVVQALRGGPRTLERRERILATLAGTLDAGSRDGARGSAARGSVLTPLTAEGLVGAAVAVVHARLLRREPEPLRGLLGELMAMIALPYRGPAAARREHVRPIEIVPAAADPDQTIGGRYASDPLRDVPMRLTFRTARVLEGVAERPGASNRALADYAGVSDPGQISKLLARLERVGLLTNMGSGHAKGEPNAWTLTPKGTQVAQSIRMHAPYARSAA